jgi:hypothetical protein
MIGWDDYLMKQEQYRDQLREAERQRLARLVADDCQESASGQTIRTLVSGMRKRRPSRGQVPCGENNRFSEKAV